MSTSMADYPPHVTWADLGLSDRCAAPPLHRFMLLVSTHTRKSTHRCPNALRIRTLQDLRNGALH